MSARRGPSRAAAAPAVVLAAALFSLSLPGRPSAASPATPAALLVSPKLPHPGEPLRVLAAFETDPAKTKIVLRGASGPVEAASSKRGGGPPFWIAAEFAAAPPGDLSVVLVTGRDEVTAGPERFLAPARGWSRAAEVLYSAWIEALFVDADERSSWPVLHDVTRDRSRNLLHDHLGLGEDGTSDAALIMTPDCADDPFYLRAYFSWKLGLPFGFHETSWGTIESPPQAGRLRMLPVPAAPTVAASSAISVAAMTRYLNEIKNSVHAGNGRTALDADGTDYYPLPLTRKALKPGTVYADPYGHTFVIVRWVPQTRKSPGLLLAVDAQPDGTIGVKRFWKGNFLFTTEDVVGEPGFKAFRPIVLESGRPRLLTNREIAASPDYGDFSLQQKGMSPDAFYGVMERLINPDPLDAVASLEGLIGALQEQLIVRVESVANGEAYMQAHPGTVVPMPSGKGIFQALGLWEDYSTPNRDLRLLIAIDTVLEFPDKAARNPEAYEMAGRKTPEAVRRELQGLLDRRAEEIKITYNRSDGRPQALTLAEIFRRQDAFEMGYNPNDSVEIRWGAPEGSEERAKARRRVPAWQLARMNELRPWFHKRLRPS